MTIRVGSCSQKNNRTENNPKNKRIPVKILHHIIIYFFYMNLSIKVKLKKYTDYFFFSRSVVLGRYKENKFHTIGFK